MRQFILKYLLSLLLMVPLYANIDARIEAIQNASLEERFMLMNAFKREVVHMQEEERIDAITKLKSITRSQHSDRALRELEKHTKPKYIHKDHEISKTKERTEVHSEEDHEVEDHMESETEDHVEDETEDHIEDETEDHIEDETEDHIEDETEDHIEDETEDHIEDETEDHIEDETDDD